MDNTSSKNRISSKKILMMGGLISVVVGFLSFLPIIMNHSGQYIDHGDVISQYVPFIKELKRMIASGNFSWSWNSFLGDDFVSAYSYYTVFNPFAWFVAIFPNKWILYGIFIATLLKLFISTILSTLYIRTFCKKDFFAVIGALIYTFSGFTIVNTNFYFFLDVIAVFPLLMYGLEVLISDNKRAVYILALFINASINYYFFVSTVFLIIVYVFFRLSLYKISSWKEHKKTFFNILICSIIGTGLAGIALIPSFLSVMNSTKAVENIGENFNLFYWPQRILENFKILLAPIESSRFRAFYDSSTVSSNGVYLPIFGCVFVVKYIISKKDWLKKLCIFLLICLFVPALNSAFCLYSSLVYTRWLYGMALVFALTTAISLEKMEEQNNKNKKILTLTTIFTFFLLVIPTILYFLYSKGINLLNRFASACVLECFMGFEAIIIMLILTALNYLGLWYICFRKKRNASIMLIVVIAGCVLNYGVYNALNYNKHFWSRDIDYFYEKAFVEGEEREGLEFEYRIDNPTHIWNYGLYNNVPSVNYYNSIQNIKISEFVRKVGMCTGDSDTMIKVSGTNAEYIDALLSVKYYYDYDGEGNIPEGFIYTKTENGVDIYENSNYLPMGFTYEQFFLEDQVSELACDEISKIMLNALIIKSEDASLASKYLKYNTDINIFGDLSESVSKRKKENCYYFQGNSSGFDASINLSKPNIVFFSIPNNEGWDITVNGEKAEIIEVNYGFIGICCDEGVNKISASYNTRGLKEGLTCSGISLFAWMILEIINKKTLKGIYNNDLRNNPIIQRRKDDR